MLRKSISFAFTTTTFFLLDTVDYRIRDFLYSFSIVQSLPPHSLFILLSNMQLNIISPIVGLTFAAVTFALPTEDISLYTFLSKRTISPDNTCGNVLNGNNNGYSCNSTVNSGGCCSQYGYCVS
jgi:hypothetical protein